MTITINLFIRLWNVGTEKNQITEINDIRKESPKKNVWLNI